MAELKSCPFCGAEAEYIKQGYLTGGYDYGRIKCQKCGVTQTIPKVREEATRDWNTRTPKERGREK